MSSENIFNKIFKNTTTSYNPNKNGISEGKTGSDIERILAFDKLEIEDPLPYKYSWKKVVLNAKLRNTTICGATETILVHQKIFR